jgi:Ca-activated chloride channel family protein
MIWTENGVPRASEVPILGTEPPGLDAPLAAAVAGWGLLLRGELDLETWSYEDAARLAEENRNETPLAAEIPALIPLSARISP